MDVSSNNILAIDNFYADDSSTFDSNEPIGPKLEISNSKAIKIPAELNDIPPPLTNGQYPS
ncbi:hypothetical protein BJX68DRAFT_245751 [Aspergillus pseudodeflectus]|uniref:Uncharacterized protein n=1 Tax=Aspergillus pseudodeflectus TaxID=176178 RepID=A0ABR4JMB4_9EURO